MKKYHFNREDTKMLNRIFWRSGFLFSSFNMVNMQGQGFAYTMLPAIDKLYKGDEKKRIEAFKRSSGFFNSNAAVSGFIYGLVYAMEKENACDQDSGMDGNTITSIKTALMGPLAGIGDSLFFNTIRVIAAGIAISLCAGGSILGPAFFILLYGGSSLMTRYLLIRTGYSVGSSFIEKIFNSGILERLTKAASIVGLVMVGAMVAGTVKINLALNWTLGGSKLSIQSVLDSIMPGILSLLLLYGVVKLLKKGHKATGIVLGLLVLCIILAALGVF